MYILINATRLFNPNNHYLGLTRLTLQDMDQYLAFSEFFKELFQSYDIEFLKYIILNPFRSIKTLARILTMNAKSVMEDCSSLAK